MTDKNQSMQEAEVHPMDEAATHAVAQGWCEPETSSMEMDVVLATAIARAVSRVLRNWYDTAAQHCRNEEYYRGLVVEIGKMLGDDAFISDDGSVQKDVLCAKVPELVRARLGHQLNITEAIPIEIRIVFDGPPGPESGRFVEVENVEGHSIRVGEWQERPDGYWELRIPKVGLK